MLSTKFKNFTFVGFFLAVVSSIITSLAPKNPEPLQMNTINNATLRQYSGGDNVHIPVISCCIGGFVPRCHFTEFTDTTGMGIYGTLILDMQGYFYDTQGNTSISIPNNVDSTSYLVRIG